jgi:site-specific recombinase XerD
MSSLYRRNNIYWLSFRLHGKSYCISLRTRDRSTALYKKAEKDRELIEGRDVIPRADTLCAPLLEEFRNYNLHRKTKDANFDDCGRIQKFLSWSGITTFSQITEQRLQKYLNHRFATEKISPRTANMIITNIKTWLNFCVKNRRIPENSLSRMKKFKEPVNPKRFLSREEINALLKETLNPNNYCDGDPSLYPVIATGVYAGLRKQEIFSLEWQDVNFKRGEITIRNKDNFAPKSRKFRVIPLHGSLKKILKPLTKISGQCFDITNQRRLFGRIIRKVNLQGIGWHSLRHTFASQLVMAGVDLATVAKLLGHSSITTTMIYSHLSPDHVRGAINKLNF